MSAEIPPQVQETIRRLGVVAQRLEPIVRRALGRGSSVPPQQRQAVKGLASAQMIGLALCDLLILAPLATEERLREDIPAHCAAVQAAMRWALLHEEPDYEATTLHRLREVARAYGHVARAAWQRRGVAAEAALASQPWVVRKAKGAMLTAAMASMPDPYDALRDIFCPEGIDVPAAKVEYAGIDQGFSWAFEPLGVPAPVAEEAPIPVTG